MDPNVGFYYLAGSAGILASSGITVTPLITGPVSNTDPNDPFSLVVGISPTDTLPGGEALTITFKLAPDGDAISGQRLNINLVSGDAPAQTCESTGENISTVRGNLIVKKDPATQDATVGEVVTWTVILRNNGLGNVYGAVFTDTGGVGLANIGVDPPIAPTGPIYDAADYRRRFPDGRIGSNPSLANPEAGEQLFKQALAGLDEDYRKFSA